jgi:hypothetical protein
MPPPWLGTVLLVAGHVECWGAIVALIGVAERYWNHNHRWRGTLTEAVFPFYLIHQTVIVVTEFWITPFHLGPVIEATILIAATVVGCWTFYLIGRRIGWLRPLIGLKRRVRPMPADQNNVSPPQRPRGEGANAAGAANPVPVRSSSTRPRGSAHERGRQVSKQVQRLRATDGS